MQFINLSAQYKRIKEKLDAQLLDTVGSGKYINGPQIVQLEKWLAEYTERKFCVTCGSGTDAMLLALKCWGVGKNDGVFVPDFSFVATGEVVVRCGATPVFVDVDEKTFNIDVSDLERKIKKTIEEGKVTPKVVIFVDLFGQPADYDGIYAAAEKYNLLVLEDGSQGFGGTYKNKKVCSLGDVSATSFFPSNPLGCYGDGGAVFTDDDNIAQTVRSLKNHGKNPVDNEDYSLVGMNSRLDTVQATVLLCKSDIFDGEVFTRQLAAECYNMHLNGFVEIPEILSGCTSSRAQYTVKLETSEQRNRVVEGLKEQLVPTKVYYSKPLHLQNAFKKYAENEEICPVSADLCDRVLSLPMHPYLNDRMIKTICDILKKFL